MAKWDSKNLEIRSKSVEQTLVPLVTQVLNNCNDSVLVRSAWMNRYCQAFYTIQSSFRFET